MASTSNACSAARCLRNFTACDLYVRQGSQLGDASELAGKRIGMYSCSASGAIWYRHFLAWRGVDASVVRWTIGDVDEAFSIRSEPELPSTQTAAAADGSRGHHALESRTPRRLPVAQAGRRAGFGHIKQTRGFRQFLLGGLPAVRAEWAMICTAHNLIKLANAAT